LSPSDYIATLMRLAAQAPDDLTWRAGFRRAFAELRPQLDLHPRGRRAVDIFDSAAHTVRAVAAESLPLALGLTMHLYPLCVLRCVPLPWFSRGALLRSRLLREIDERGLILANAGSERAAGLQGPVSLRADGGDIVVNGTYDYVSLANVSDLVLFSAPMGSVTVFCIADLTRRRARIGEPRFDGSMRLSDTCSVSFEDHRVPRDHYVEVPTASAVQCMTHYQRSWFQMLLCEAYLRRVEVLRERFGLVRSLESTVNLHELALLRDYALRLLGEARTPADMETLGKVTALIKLRASWCGLSMAAALRTQDPVSARELGYLQRQPTSDARILEQLVAPSRDDGAALSRRATRTAGHGTLPAWLRCAPSSGAA
jgi:alkylation response protein AidB-like acyl-CoA dehydrogenase